MDGRVSHFTDLRVWQEAHALVLDVYKVTRRFPSEERFALTSQVRRASVSVTVNIAEGFGRNSAKDKLQFYLIARGSLLELESHLLIARDLSYLSGAEFCRLEKQTRHIARLLTAFVKTAANRKNV